MLNALLLNTLLFLHPLHVTLTSVNQAQGSDTLKVFFRMYYDDLLNDYKLYDPGYNFEMVSGKKTISEDRINSYFNDKVHIYINHKLLTGKISDISNNYYEICFDLIYISDRNPGKFKIKNQVMTKLYSDQTNMVFININKYEDTMKLTSKHYKETRNLE